MALDWTPWDPGLPAAAALGGQPLLVVVAPDWWPDRERLEARLLSRPPLAARLAETVRLVAATPEQVPALTATLPADVWPGLVVLAGPDELVWAGPWAGPGDLAAALDRAATRLADTAVPETISVPAERAPGAIDASIPPAIEAALLSDEDERHGGFGTGQKFPHPEALDYALVRLAEARNPRLAGTLTRALDAMAGGALRDPVSGAFFASCRTRDWREPDTEVLLTLNAGLARNYLEASQVLRRPGDLAVAAGVLDMLLRDLADPTTGLLVESLAPAPEVYALPAAERLTRRPPRPSERRTTVGNARALSALLGGGALLERPELTAAARDLAAALLRQLHRPGKGMARLLDGQGALHPGRMIDQAETARALLNLLQFTGERAWLPTLEELLERLVTRHVLDDGGLGDPGPTAARPSQQQILEGAVACEALLRAATCLGRPELADVAVTALERNADDFRRYGWAMAAYGRSVELVLHPPLHVLVVGAGDDERSTALLATAGRVHLSSRLVQLLEPGPDDERMARLGAPTADEPAAYVRFGGVLAGPFADPEALGQALPRLARLRLEQPGPV